MDIASAIALNNGVAMPRLGLGVYRTGAGERTERAVRWALEAGYRHIDTAAFYQNEAEVGRALRRAESDGLAARKDVFVTTKLWNSDHGYDPALRAFDASLAALGLEYVDLYLIHWPVQPGRLDSWRALERVHADGRARAIGVSNYTPRHLQELLDASRTVPAVNQIELHPFLQQTETVAFCRAHGIAVEAYSPLGKGHLLEDPKLRAIADQVGRPAAQVLLRWSMQKGYIAIPKSANRARIFENADIFSFALNERQMQALDQLDRNLHVTWDPTNEP